MNPFDPSSIACSMAPVGPNCAISLSSDECVSLAHGGGGAATQRLLDDFVRPFFSNPELNVVHDGAMFDVEKGRMAFSCDAFVVKPLSFHGADIGKLAIDGVVNDLAMCGARAQRLSLSLIMEEGFPLECLRRIMESMAREVREVKVRVVTGDTKVVGKGGADGIYICVSGLGVIPERVDVRPQRVCEGDVIVLSGDIGRHGVAVMAAREDMALDVPVESDCASLLDPVMDLLGSIGADVHVLRDLTRGGLATALLELSASSGLGFEIDETVVPVCDGVRGACELLGLDPLYVANEGRMVVLVRAHSVSTLLTSLHRHSVTSGAVCIGRVGSEVPGGCVVSRNAYGTHRRLTLLNGEQLPRIC